MIRRRTLGGAVLAFALGAGCAPESGSPPSGTPPREGRFGSLRDLVLVERTDEGRVRVVFVDRFEATRADWAQFAVTSAGLAVDAGAVVVSGNPALPVAGVDLRQARAFAKWRFGRLPRVDDWAAAVGDGRHRYPWGSREDWTRANAGELGLGQPTPVGTFESGRIGTDQPYDLIGNVSEWTETVAFGRRTDPPELEPGEWFVAGRRRVLRSPSAAIWQLPGGIVPLVFAVQACGDHVPREVVGADFQTSMTTLAEPVAAGDRRARTGLRVCCTPRELLDAMLASPAAPMPADLEQLRRFVRRDGHRPVLARALRERGDEPAVNESLHQVLRAELQP